MNTQLWIDKLVVPQYAVGTGSERHINKLNEYLPGSLFVIQEYFGALDVTNNTKRTYLNAVKRAVKFAFRERFYTDYALRSAIDFFFHDIMPKRDSKVRAKYLEEHLIQRLIDEAGLKTSLIIQNLYTIGRRVSELCNLRWDQISRESDSLAVAEVRAKGKNYDVFRIPIKLLEINRAVFRGKTYMIETKESDINNRNNIHKLIRNAGIQILGRPLHAHIFRHSFATHQIRRNPGKIRAIMAQGGWNNYNEFIGTYCHDMIEESDFRLMPQAHAMPDAESVERPPAMSDADFFLRTA